MKKYASSWGFKQALTGLAIMGAMLLSHAVQAVAPSEFAGAWYRFQTEANASPSYHYYWFSPDGRYLEGIPVEGRYTTFDCATPRTKDEWQSCGTYSLKGSKVILSNSVTGKAEACDITLKNSKLEVCGDSYTRLKPVKSGLLEGEFQHLSVFNGPTFINADGSSSVSGGQSRKSITFKKDGSFTSDRSSFGAFSSSTVAAYSGSSDSTGGSYTVLNGVLTLKFKEGAVLRYTLLWLDRENIFIDDTIYWRKGGGAGARDVQTYLPAIERGSGKPVPKSYADPIRFVPFNDQLSQRDRSFIALSTIVNESDDDATLYWRCDAKALQVHLSADDILTDAEGTTPLTYRFDNQAIQQDFWTNPKKAEPRLEIRTTASSAFAPSSSVAGLTQSASQSKRLAVQTLEDGKPKTYVFDLTGFNGALQKLKCKSGFGGSRAVIGAFSVETRVDVNSGSSTTMARTLTTKGEDRNADDGWDPYKNSRTALMWRCDASAQPQIVLLPWESIITNDEDVDVGFSFDGGQGYEDTWQSMIPDNKPIDSDLEFHRGHRAPVARVLALTKAALSAKSFRLTIFDNGGGVYSKRYSFSLEGLGTALARLPCFVKAGLGGAAVTPTTKPPVTPIPVIKPSVVTTTPVTKPPVTSSPAAPALSAPALLERARVAHGGAALDKIRTYTERGESTVFVNGQSAVLNVTSSADVTAQIVRAEYAVNGQRALIAQVSPLEAWQWTAQTGVQPMAESDAADLRSAFSTGWFGLRGNVKPDKLEVVAVGGNQALRVTNKGLTVTYSFDAAGRIASQTAQSADGEIVVRQSDYRQVQGVWIAFLSESFLNAKRTRTDRTLEVQINPVLSAETFAKP